MERHRPRLCMCSRGVSAGAVAGGAASVEPPTRLLPCDQLVPGSTLELTEEVVELGACVRASVIPCSSSCWELSG